VREYVNIGGRFALGRNKNEKTTNKNDGKYQGYANNPKRFWIERQRRNKIQR
jgi:hypothetical protein